MRFADEVLAPTGSVAGGKITATELSMAKQLVESMSGKFNPEKFKDTYRADLKRRVQEKIKRKETHSLDVEMPKTDDRPKAQVIDLMEALKASLKNGKSRSTPRSTRSTPRAAAKRKRA